MQRNRPLLVAIVVAWAVGCGKTDSAKTPSPQPTPTVEVVSDPAAVASARKAWEDYRARTLGAIFDDPSHFQTYDDEAVELLRSDLERSRRELAARRDDAAQPAEARVRATVALKVLGVAPDPAALVALAETEGGALKVLGDIDELYKPGEPLPEPMRQFIVRSLGAKDGTLALEAARDAGRYQVAEAADPVVARVRADPAAAPTYFLTAAASLRPSAEVLDVLVARMGDVMRSEAYFMVDAIAGLAKSTTDPGLRRRAADACVEYLKNRPVEGVHPGLPMNGQVIDTEMLSAFDTITRAVPPEVAKQMLADVTRGSGHLGIAQMGLAELQKHDPDLAARVSRERRVPIPSEESARESPPEQKGMTSQEAAVVCVRHKVITQAEADAALAEIAARSKNAPSPTSAPGAPVAGPLQPGGDSDEDAEEFTDAGVEGLLCAARRFASFDVETGMVPNRHDRLILEIAESSAGRFKPEAVLETYKEGGTDEDAGTYAVQFIHGGKLYRFNPRDLGDWYDLEAVLLAVNRALGDAGVADRFVPLDSDGQFAELVFADPAAVLAAAAELGRAVSTDPDNARKEGKAFEGKVIEQLLQKK